MDPWKECTSKKVNNRGNILGKSRKIFRSKKCLDPNQAEKFFHLHREKVGKIVRVEMIEYDKPVPTKKWAAYPLRLIDEKGNELWISGLTSGYHGSGPVSTANILLEACTEVSNIPKSKDGIWEIVSRCHSFTLGNFPDV